MAQFNSEGLVRLQTYMAGKTLSDSQATAVVSADVVEMQDAAESNTRRRYYRIAEDDESITFSCILGSSQQQLVLTKATKQLSITTTELGGAITPGSITTDMLANGAVTGSKIAAQTITTGKIADRAVSESKIAFGTIEAQNLAAGAVTSEKLAAGLDVSGLFFILPDGTQFPYTLTEEDKTKLENAIFLVTKDQDGIVYVTSPTGTLNKFQGKWYGISGRDTIAEESVGDGKIYPAGEYFISDPYAVKVNAQTLTDEQKAQARENIGAAEAANTSGEEEPIA